MPLGNSIPSVPVHDINDNIADCMRQEMVPGPVKTKFNFLINTINHEDQLTSITF
jgi:hypothetical protein